MPNTHSSLNRGPRGPLVFDMRSLSRQAGSWRDETRVVPAPADLRLELVSVPEGSDVELQLKFEAVTEGVLVSGSATAPVTGECARCLGPVASTVTVSLLELYQYPEERLRGAKQESRQESWYDEAEESADADEVRFLDGELLDLEPAFRDAVVLALPMSPLCRDDCPGLCVTCGVPLAEAGPEHGHEDRSDPRWAGLTKLELDKLQPKEG
jgi:uncharacterized protein